MIKQILLAGDSTVTGKNMDTNYSNGVCHTGWGEMLPLHLGPDYLVRNFAKSGLTTDSFRIEGHFKQLLNIVNKEDYVLFQFGHNDQKISELRCDSRYRTNIVNYVEEIRAHEATPILVTSLGRNSWNCTNGEYNDLLYDYCATIRKIGIEYNVPVIDLHDKSVQWIKKQGREHVKKYFYPGDFTHTNDYGAFKIASFVADELLDIIDPNDECMPWYDLCQSKIPSYLFNESNRHISKTESLKIVIKLNGYFAVNTNDNTNDIEEIRIAKQNGFCIFENNLDSFITQIEFLKLLITSSCGREVIKDDVKKLLIHATNDLLTINKMLEYLNKYEESVGYTNMSKKIEILGS